VTRGTEGGEFGEVDATLGRGDERRYAVCVLAQVPAQRVLRELTLCGFSPTGIGRLSDQD
jgi:hypothetical protein